jgi:hypothetical protein
MGRRALGVDPRGTGLKIVFLVYASLWLAALVGYLRYPPPWRPVLAIVAVGTLWYLLPGTVLSIAELVLLAAGTGIRRAVGAGMAG